jgi:hypothetical protein
MASKEKSLDDEMKELNEELKSMGYNSLGEAYSAVQKDVKNRTKAQRDGAKMAGVIKTCQKCRGSAEKRCTGCFLVWYCGRDCQRTDWSNHMEDCKKTRSEYEEVEMLDLGGLSTAISLQGKKDPIHHGTKTTPKVDYFVVKVQISFGGREIMLVYNKARDVQYHLSPETTLGARLKEQILKNDSMGTRKGYFYSIVRENKQFIHPQILPPETW